MIGQKNERYSGSDNSADNRNSSFSFHPRVRVMGGGVEGHARHDDLRNAE